MRVIEGIPVDRAKLRTTLTYAVSDAVQVGIEVNPLDDDFGPLANWRVLGETRHRPALVLGTSSSQIGTRSGRALYGTLSKDLEPWIGLPVAPYVGLGFVTQDDDWVGLYGGTIRWTERYSTTHFYDGDNLHHMLSRATEDGQVGLLLVQQDSEYYFGLTYGFAFGGGD